jgi:hypothetical protein
MLSSLHKVNKLLFLERIRHAYMDPGDLNTELHNLLLPGAGIYFRHDAECDILSQHITLPFFSLWINDIFSKKDILLRPFSPIPIHTLHFMFEDSLQIQLRQEAGYLLEERECNLFNLFPGLHKIPMPHNKKILSLHINIDPSAIPSLVKKFPVLQLLQDAQTSTISGPVNIYPYQINSTCDFLIKQILSCNYTGLRAERFFYRCCLDLLLNIAEQQAASDQRILFTTIIHGAAYQQLFKYLEYHPHKRHSIVELAYIFEIPADQLEYGFRQLFSISVADFVLMTKMLFVYNRLQSKVFPCSLIAEVTGYETELEMIQLVESYFDIKL